jgi:ribosomal protein S18 acetylase RimI-like enzyme
LEIEYAAFSGDMISPRSWRELMGSDAASVIVAEDARHVFGDYVTLFNARTTIARLYSIAVAEDWRQRGMAKLMTQDAIVRSIARGATRLRLETRADNAKAQRLFEGLGFIAFDRVHGHYEDGTEAVRYERRLVGEATP